MGAGGRGAGSLEPDGPVIVACDVARYGRDRTVVVKRQGARARIVQKINGQDTMKIAEYLKGYCESEKANFLVVDETGVGGGVVDRAEAARPAGAEAGAVRGRFVADEPEVSREPWGGGCGGSCGTGTSRATWTRTTTRT